MKKKKRALPNKQISHKIRLSAVRKEQVRQGIFDGRYRTKAIPCAKVYKRVKFNRNQESHFKPC
jgi:hypothetical protein